MQCFFSLDLAVEYQDKLEEYTYNKKTYTDKNELYLDILLD